MLNSELLRRASPLDGGLGVFLRQTLQPGALRKYLMLGKKKIN
jgi:hypothetical protein